MSISAQNVKELRDKTGAGMMDCKKALVDSNGDIEKAIEFLRKTGIAKAEKKGSREAKEGIVYSYIHHGGRLGVLVELNCETDFVAKTDGFMDLAHNLAMQIAATNPVAISPGKYPLKTFLRKNGIFIFLKQKIQENRTILLKRSLMVESTNLFKKYVYWNSHLSKILINVWET